MKIYSHSGTMGGILMKRAFPVIGKKYMVFLTFILSVMLVLLPAAGFAVQESSDLEDFLRNVTISGAVQNEDGAYMVDPSQEYSLIASFSESSSYQFDNDATLFYQMPEGINVLNEQSGNIQINIVYMGKTYQVDATYDLGTDGRLEINFDQTDPPSAERPGQLLFQFVKSRVDLDFERICVVFDGRFVFFGFSDFWHFYCRKKKCDGI